MLNPADSPELHRRCVDTTLGFMKRIILVALILLLGTACGATVTPPSPEQNGREVVLLQHARHSSLLLTRADRGRVRYAYGDWAWYVEGETGVISGARALFWPSRAGLGRAEFPPLRAQPVRPQPNSPGVELPNERLEQLIGVGVDKAHYFSVSPRRVDTLLERLDGEYSASGEQPYFRAGRHLYFVPHERPYHLLHSSNPVVADWLRTLGLEVRGSPLLGIWNIAESGKADSLGGFPPPTEVD